MGLCGLAHLRVSLGVCLNMDLWVSFSRLARRRVGLNVSRFRMDFSGLGCRNLGVSRLNMDWVNMLRLSEGFGMSLLGRGVSLLGR